MRLKLFVIAITLSLLLSGMLVVVGGEAKDGGYKVIQENEAFFDVEITNYDHEVEKNETVTVKYKVTNTGDAEGTQDILFGRKTNESLCRNLARRDLMEKEGVEDPNEYMEKRIEYYEEKKTEKVHYNIRLGPGDEKTGIFTWEANQTGEQEFEVFSDNTSDSKTVTVGENTPGFTSTLILIAGVTAVAIYRKKKR